MGKPTRSPASSEPGRGRRHYTSGCGAAAEAAAVWAALSSAVVVAVESAVESAGAMGTGDVGLAGTMSAAAVGRLGARCGGFWAFAAAAVAAAAVAAARSFAAVAGGSPLSPLSGAPLCSLGSVRPSARPLNFLDGEASSSSVVGLLGRFCWTSTDFRSSSSRRISWTAGGVVSSATRCASSHLVPSGSA